MKRNVKSDSSVQNNWETLHTRMKNQEINVDERTMGSRDMVKELSSMNLNAKNAANITEGTGLHSQKISNLCVYFATMSAVRYELKKVFENSKSTDVNMDNKYGFIPIPAGKSIDELFEEKEFQFENFFNNEIIPFPNALSFERMLSVLLGCVSPRALSGLVKTINIHFRNIIILKF